MAPMTNRVKVLSHLQGLVIEPNNFAFEVKAEFRLKSTISDGRPAGRPGLSGTNTISAQAGAGTGAELGNDMMGKYDSTLG